MKKINYLLFTLVLLLMMFIPKSYAASNPYSKYQNVQNVKSVACTWGAWQAAYDRMGVSLPKWGNAVNWYNKAKEAGYSVGTEYKPESIAVFKGAWGYGHVAYVIEKHDECDAYTCDTVFTTIEGGQIFVEADVNGEALLDENGNKHYYAGYEDGYCNPCKKYNFTINDSNFLGYIYLDNAPKNPPASSNSNNTTKTETKTEEVKKSNNSYLKSLTLSNGEIEFTKDTLNYSITLENKIDKLIIEAEPEDSKAKIDLKEEYPLEVGENKISLVVTAEDNTTKNYELNVIREEEIKEEKEEVETDKKNNKTSIKNTFNNQEIYLFCGLIVLFMITLIVIIIAIKVKEKTHQSNKKK